MKIKKFVFIAAALMMGLAVMSAYAADLITPQQAIDTAREYGDGMVIQADLDAKKGVVAYEVEILDTNGTVHKTRINALTGTVLSQRSERKPAHIAAELRTAKVSHSQADRAVQNRLPGSRVVESELKVKNGRAAYELTVIDVNGIEYEAVVDAQNGSLISLKQEENFRGAPGISLNAAEKAALNTVEGSPLEAKLDKDDGQLFYKVKVLSDNGQIYDVRVDAATGRVIKFKLDD